MAEHEFVDGQAGGEPDDPLSAAVAALTERADALPNDTAAGPETASDDATETAGVTADAAAEPEQPTAVASADASETTGAAATSEAAATTEAAPAEADDLLGELSRAMRAAAGSRHVRVGEELAAQRAAQVEAIKKRAASEADEIKKSSKRDIGEVEAWMKTATELIAAERVRRIDARREKLQAELARQDVIIERAVLSVEAAVEDHQTKLDAFFQQLEGESDPAEIARLATSMPSLPSLADAADEGRRRAAAEYARLEEPLPEGVIAAEAAAAAQAPESSMEVSTSRLMAAMGGSSDNGTDIVRPWVSAPEAMETAPVDQGGWTTQSGTPERFETEATAATADAIAATELNDTETQGRDSVEATISDGSEGPEADETPTLIDDSAPLLRTIPSSRPIDRLRPPWNRKPDDEPAQES